MHTLSSMHTLSILSIQHPSPIQQLSPMVMFHGDLITTLFFKTRPLPILAPNSLRTAILGNINGFHDALTKNAFTKYQIIVLILPAPLSKFEPSKAAKFTLFCMVLTSFLFSFEFFPLHLCSFSLHGVIGVLPYEGVYFLLCTYRTT